PNERWTLEADTAWFHWSEERDINVRFSETNPVRLAVLTNNGNGNPVPVDARDAWSFATGVNYKANEKWQLRSGFWYEPWALPENNFSPAFLDLSRYGLSAGAG